MTMRGNWKMTYNKYHAIRTDVDGIKFASKGEAQHYIYLKGLENLGKIKNLELQTKFSIDLNGVHVCNYIADFEYDDENGHHVVDYKGCVTPVFRLKRKLIKALYGVDIELV